MVNRSKAKKMDKILHELLKDSSQSDRQIAKKLDVSQPTVSRVKKELVNKRFIEAFTIIPNFFNIGYELMAISFVKFSNALSSREEDQKALGNAQRWMNEQPNVIFCSFCRGLDSDGFMISLHKNYQDFDRFIINHNYELGHQLKAVRSALVNLSADQTIKPFNFKYLGEKQDFDLK